MVWLLVCQGYRSLQRVWLAEREEEESGAAKVNEMVCVCHAARHFLVAPQLVVCANSTPISVDFDRIDVVKVRD